MYLSEKFQAENILCNGPRKKIHLSNPPKSKKQAKLTRKKATNTTPTFKNTSLKLVKQVTAAAQLNKLPNYITYIITLD